MAEVSYAMDLHPLQDSFRFRVRFLGWSFARYLIDEKGDLSFNRLDKSRNQLEKGHFPTGPMMEGDAIIYSHILSCLRSITENQKIAMWIKKFSIPLCHRKAEEIVRETIWPDLAPRLQTFHIRRAALASWMTLLRQTTGSCFATAPAILIQKYAPEGFLKDLYDLLSLGQLQRTFGGKRYSVPLSPTPGMGDLQKPLPPLSSLESLTYAPGLRIALDEKELSHLRKRLSQIEKRAETPEEVIKLYLLDALNLSEKEIAEEEYLSKIQMTPLLAKHSAIYYQRPSERGKKVTAFKRQYARACSSFRSLTDSSLLRSWEYSIASFSDVKFDFARWNLYVGLGLHPDQKGGIGEFLHRIIETKLDACNEDLAKLHRDYEQAVSHVQTMEALFQRSLSDAHRRQLKNELAGAVHAANTVLEMRDRAAAIGEALSNSFSQVLSQYIEKLQDHFQEVFDPTIQSKESNFYEDGPAGFRLVYKHGREDASLWTQIHSKEEYIHSLRDFFSSIESELQVISPLGKEFVSDVTTEILRYLQLSEFFDSAVERSKAQGRESPWHYMSGGTMQTLIQNYFCLEKLPTEVSLTPHSEEELFSFFLQNVREDQNPLLMHSPNHAFILRPDWFGSQVDAKITKNREVVNNWNFDEEMKEHLVHRLSDQLSILERPLFLHLYRQKSITQTNAQFRSFLIQSLQGIPDSQLKSPISTVDSLIYEHFPSFHRKEAKTALEALLKMFLDPANIRLEVDEAILGSWELLQKAKELLIQETKIAFAERDWDMELADAARRFGWSYPAPLLFADTNWSSWYFGWILNPSTAELELWRLNRVGTRGFPMSDWKKFTSLENRLPWAILTKSEEYALQ